MSDPPPARRTVNLTQAGYISIHLYRRFFSPQVARKQKIPPKKIFYWKNEAPFKAGRRGSNMKNVRHGERVSRHEKPDLSAPRRLHGNLPSAQSGSENRRSGGSARAGKKSLTTHGICDIL